MMAAPHYYQERKFSCGPATLRMIIESLIQQDVGEAILIELTGAKANIGTHLTTFEKNLPQLFQTLCEQLKIPNHFEYHIQQESTFEDIQTLQQQGYRVMINYTCRLGPHWAAVHAIDQKNIILMDPEYGPHHSIALQDLKWQGGQAHNLTHRALIAIQYRSSLPR